MIRSTFALLCSLFAMFFLLGLSSPSRAAAPDRALVSGGITDPSGVYDQISISATDSTDTGTISLTTSNAHYLAAINSAVITNVSVSVTGSSTVNGVTTTMAATLTRPDVTSTRWTVVSFTVVQGSTNLTFSNQLLRGGVLLI